MSTFYIGKRNLNYKGNFLKNFTSKDGEKTFKFGGKKKLKFLYYNKLGHKLRIVKHKLQQSIQVRNNQTL
jgi:hypothetical protein